MDGGRRINEIQKACATLATWRTNWPFTSNTELSQALRCAEDEKGYRRGWYSDDRLIAGTAGNPKFFSVLAKLLEAEGTAADPDPYVVDLATAIIDADERMSS